MSVGVINHIPNPTLEQAAALAAAAEAAGADWLGTADAFWWRDVWVTLAAMARATEKLVIGPVVTNPYTRHAFQTLAAVATLQDIAGPRVLLGIGAGGSEVGAATGVSRRDAPERVCALVELLHRVSTGAPLDEGSGRTLELPLARPPVLIGARADRMLGVVGSHADWALLHSVPDSELDRTAKLITESAQQRKIPTPGPTLVWAPLVERSEDLRHHICYSALNTSGECRARWGMDGEQAATIREHLVRGDVSGAIALVPDAAFDDLIVKGDDPEGVAARGRQIGATSLAVHCFDAERLADEVAWARDVVARLPT